MAEMFGKQTGLQPRPRRVDAPLRRRHAASSAATRSSAGGLPLAVGLALADQPARPRPGHRLLLRRGRHRRGRVPRVAQPRGAVAAAGAVLLREQPLRDGHRARARSTPAPTWRCAPRRTAWPPGRSTAWTCSRSRTRPGGRSRRSAAAPARTSSSCAPTASARTRCTTPTATARRPRSSAWKQHDPIDALVAARMRADGELDRRPGRAAIEPEVAAEIDAAVDGRRAGHRSSRSRT